MGFFRLCRAFVIGLTGIKWIFLQRDFLHPTVYYP